MFTQNTYFVQVEPGSVLFGPDQTVSDVLDHGQHIPLRIRLSPKVITDATDTVPIKILICSSRNNLPIMSMLNL